MSNAYGVLTYGDAKDLVVTLDQRELFTVAQEYLDRYTAEFRAASSILVAQTTEEYKLFYNLPGGGRMQRRGGQAQSHAVKTFGNWDVGLPIEEFGDQIAGTMHALNRMNLERFQNNLDTVRIRNLNTRRFMMLKAILNNVTWTFTDEDYGSISIYPLANGDANLFPPLRGSETEATANNYAGSNYATSSISDTNNPIAFIVGKLTERFGVEQGGSNIVTFINSAEKAKVEALADFTEVPDRFVIPGLNVNKVTGMPLVPGVIIGRASGSWISEWPDMPATYMFGTHLGQSAPLLERVPETRYGGRAGLHIAASNARGADAANYPWDQTHYEDWFGYGAGNRLNGYVLQLVASTSYTIPTAYA